MQYRLARPPSPVGYLAQVASSWTYTGFGLPSITAPTLVLAGDGDPIVPMVNPRLLSRCIPHATMHVVTGGHLFLLDGTPGPGESIQQFLDG